MYYNSASFDIKFRKISPDGEIGIHAVFRAQFRLRSASSSLAPGTIRNKIKT
jgi:hypothetical protein